MLLKRQHSAFGSILRKETYIYIFVFTITVQFNRSLTIILEITAQLKDKWGR